MKISIRGRLTFWYSAAVGMIIILLGLGIFGVSPGASGMWQIWS
jgi:hypothetical protein